MTWTQPCCERCWINKVGGEWEHREEVDGEVLVSVRRPTLLREPGIETCCHCGEPTIIGLYIRVDPDTVAYPREEKAEA